MSPVRCIRRFALPLTLLLAACGGAAAPVSPNATSPSAVPGSAAAASPVTSAAAKPAASAAATASGKPAASAATSASGKPAASVSAAAIAPAKPGQIVSAYSEIVAANAGLWAAKEGGYFQKNGLDVDVRLIESSLAVGALLSGQVQAAGVGGSEAMAAAIEGGDLRIVGTVSPVYPYKFEVAPSIQTKDDLKGKKVGISRVGSSSDIATRAGLKKLGLEADKDVNIVQIGSLQARTAAIQSGAIQGSMASPPDTVTLEAAGFHPLIDLAALELPASNNTIVVGGPWLAGHHDEVQKYVDSLVQSIARLKKDKPFAYDVIKKYLKLDDQKLLDATYDYYIAKVTPSLPYPKPEQFTDTVAQIAQKNPKAKTFDLNKLLDTSFVQSAADRGLDKG
jgi:NitT/TauT family transport system substrate-binding protein